MLVPDKSAGTAGRNKEAELSATVEVQLIAHCKVPGNTPDEPAVGGHR